MKVWPCELRWALLACTDAMSCACVHCTALERPVLPEVKRIAARSCGFDDVFTSSKSVSWHSTSYLWIFSIIPTVNPYAEKIDPNFALMIKGEPGKSCFMLSSCPAAVLGSFDTGLMIAPIPPAATTAQNQITFSMCVSKYVTAIWPDLTISDSRKAVPYLY
jgi:hypothetical protein